MEMMSLLRAVLALMLVLGLIGAAAWAVRRFGRGGLFGARPATARRLGVIETLALDARHRLVLVKRDDRQHLLLLGPAQCVVVEQHAAALIVGSGGEP
jgi:flagellar protein FliO/FliZ